VKADIKLDRDTELVNLLPFDPLEYGTAQTSIPAIAKSPKLLSAIDDVVRRIPTSHALHLADARAMPFLHPNSVHLVLTSPPYWTLKEYERVDGQLGFVEDYEAFLLELDKVWSQCFDALVPGGRLVCVVGDVCLSRRKNAGVHSVVPLHASIQEHCRRIGFTNLSPIIWNKIANAVYEASGNGGGFLGKPYEPNAVIKNDIEFILMERKPGGYRSPSLQTRVLSVIPADKHQLWFQQIWTGVTGASTREHPAPYPIELADRLIRMFSFVGDTVLDPFMGTATTNVAAAKYFHMAANRLSTAATNLFSQFNLEIFDATAKKGGRSALIAQLPRAGYSKKSKRRKVVPSK
jgi:DNA modification methylase